jgi:ribonuclease HI
MSTIERQLQLILNKLQKWADQNGFKFSTSKTSCVHFCQKRKLHQDPVLTLGGSPIPVAAEVKFLGVTFDKKLTFIPHIKSLRDKCLKALNLLKVIANNKWGADQSTLLKLYRALVRSKLDYGSAVYGSARESYIKCLDPVANQALRLCLGAYRTSPIPSLQTLANEPPLRLRREQLALQYAVKLEATPTNPTWRAMHPNKPWSPPVGSKRTIPPLYQRISSVMPNIITHQTKVISLSTPKVPPWTLSKPRVLFDIRTESTKADTPDWIFHYKYREIRNTFQTYLPIFTDGSKDGDKTGCATILPSRVLSQRLPDGASIYTAELHAIVNALEHISRAPNNQFILFSDSMSALQAIANSDVDHPLTLDVLEKHHTLNTKGKQIIFCWLPSHIGIAGNSKADEAAKATLQLPTAAGKIPYTDLKPRITSYIQDEWQRFWDSQTNNKLHAIKDKIPARGTSTRTQLSRKDQIIINRLQIGHTRLTHAYIRQGEELPICIPCQEQLTVEHILLSCVDFSESRQKFYHANSLHHLFSSIEPSAILSFLKDIKLYYKI